MTAVGCGTVEVNPSQHSIKQREKCGLAHNKQAAANGVTKAARDIRGNFRDDAILRDDAMTISCDRKRSEDTDGSLYRF
jgi:hypothetical protein